MLGSCGGSQININGSIAVFECIFLMDSFITVLDIYAESIFLKICEELDREICVDLVLINISNGSLWIFCGFLVVEKCYLYRDLWIYTGFCGSIVDCLISISKFRRT
jgi:hypothetical protein